jgi:hypothetical protein
VGREYAREEHHSATEGSAVSLHHPLSTNEIRTAIREISSRAELARREGRTADAAELDERVRRYRDELGYRP